MRTPEDIKDAKAEYNNSLVNTELSSLPLGYVFGGALTVSDADVTLAPLIANVHGKQVTKPNITNIRDMKWIVLKVNNTRYYIYLDRYGLFFVDTVAPVIVEGRYGTYNPRTLTRHIGSISVDDNGHYHTFLDMENNAIINVDYIDFDLVNGVVPAEGRLVWNDDDGTLNLGMKGGDVNLQIGQEQILRAKNTSGSTMANGTPVLVTGASGISPEIGLSDANNLAAAENVGLTTEEIENNQFGYVTTFGMVRDIDTSGTPVGETWSNVDKIYVSDTAGELTNIRPTGSSRVLFVGVVIRAHATEGVIGVYPIHIFYIEELSGNDDGAGNAILSVDTANKRVGIGTSSPDNVLHVVKDSTASTIMAERTGTSPSQGVLRGAAGVVSVGAHSNNPMILITNNNERVRIDTGGNVGIGTSAPATSAKLELFSTTGALLLTRMTTTQRNAMTAVNGMILYNTTTNKIEGYENGAWVDI